MIDAFQDLLRIELDIFEEPVLDDLELNTLIQNKEKDIPSSKNTTGSVQVGLGTVEEEKEGNVSEVRTGTRGRMIRDTRKM